VQAANEKLADRWFRVVKRGGNSADARLVLFPHAGGSASFFRDWARLFPPGVELLAVRYPGREDRLLDPLPTSMEDLAGPLTRACSALDTMPLSFFGHSMGAIVAHEVAQRVDSLAYLFVSGCAGPAPGRTRREHPALSDSDLIAEIRMLGGTNPNALTEPELRQLFLPALRADYQIAARHPASPDGIIEAPIAAYYGDHDPDVDEEKAATWSTVTKSAFSLRHFDGGHFYLIDHAADLAADISARLQPHRQLINRS
jgi:pyochelin biosynthesis protein PchC